MRPRIGITHSSEIKVGPYADAILASGGEPIAITPGDAVDIGSLDGLLLGGGVDVDPALYGEKPAPETELPNRARDRLEQDLLADALRRDMPVLAICRGMQLLNVARGGSLVQHMEGHEARPANKAIPAHAVKIEAESELGRIHHGQAMQVNSRHHQALARVGDGLRISARAGDGTIEAVESVAHQFVLGVQWHPEDMAPEDPAQRRLFDRFVNAARR